MSSAIVQLLSAEILLVAIAVAIYLLGAFLDARSFWNGIALGGLIMAAALWFSTPLPHGQAGPVLMDPLARFLGWFALAVGVYFAVLTWRYSAAEYTGSLLLTIAGLMITAAANELVLLFLGLELISIPTYVVLYLGRRGAASQEATAKYFYLSILSSALLLYGFSFLYGTTGSTNLETIRVALAAPAATTAGLGSLAKVAMLLILAGLGFKIAAVPFQFYAPDVYQGTSNPNAALLSIVPKAAGLVVLVRIVVVAMPDLQHYGWRVTLLLSVLTMTFGNVMGLWQDNLRRLFAYSSIAHTGYMLLALAVAMTGTGMIAWNGVGAMLFYLCVYALATIGALAAFTYLGHGGRQLDGVDELAGLGRTQPLLAAALAVCLFSLTGIPPIAGFWGKLAIFASALTIHPAASGVGNLPWWFIIAAVIGVLNSAVAAAYYLRIVAVMYFRTPLAHPRPEGGLGPYLAALASALLVLMIGVQGRPLMEEAMTAVPAALRTLPATPASPAVSANPAFDHVAPGPTLVTIVREGTCSWDGSWFMPPATSRDFQKVAGQRLTAAEALLREKLTLDAQYIGGYTVECSLKALILHSTPDPDKPDALTQITSGGRMHRPEVLLGRLGDLGISRPLDIAKRMRRFDWTTDLRYETGRRDTGETTAFLKTAKAIYDWVEGQLR